MSEVVRPSDTIRVEGDDPRTITMSYGLINDITSVGIELSQIGALVLDPTVRNHVLSLVLTRRKEDGTFDTEDGVPKHADQFGLSAYEALDVIEWIVDHVAYFFMRSLLRAANVRQKYEKEASSLMSS
jgi:hypothetical protein